MFKSLFPWLIRVIPMGGHRTFIVSFLLFLAGVGMFIAAFLGFLPAEVATTSGATAILMGMQGFFGRAATTELENQLGLTLAIVVDTRDKVKQVSVPELPLPDVREGEGDNTANVRGDALHTLSNDDQATGQGWQ